jgi:CubicO group peptidase (beta-lactamase class C family)
MGYMLSGRTCSWGGWGGSVVVVDLDARMTVSYVMNQMLDQGTLGDDRGLGIVLAAYDAARPPARRAPPETGPRTSRESPPWTGT